MRLWLSLAAVVVSLSLGSVAKADHLEIHHAAWLKKTPDKDGEPLEKLPPGTLVALSKDDQDNGYYKVKTREGKRGYLYRTLVRRHPGSLPPVTHAVPALDEPGDGQPQPGNATCGGAPLTVHFFDVGQGLSALVELPDRRKILIDTGEAPKRCGAPCRAWHGHLMARLTAVLPTTRIDALWITHQHSDHLGGAEEILEKFKIGLYVDNGTDVDKATVQRVREAANKAGVPIQVVDPQNPASPIPNGGNVEFSAILPKQWTGSCSGTPNNCSIGLRIDYCRSSILFTGDAEEKEEGNLDTKGSVSLLQVGHHGSNTSSSGTFLAQAKPEYAVISSGKPDEGTNKTYCHPIASTVTNLTNIMGGPGQHTITAFDASTVKCKDGGPDNWVDVPASDHLWATARDGDIVLVTNGDGVFRRP